MAGLSLVACFWYRHGIEPRLYFTSSGTDRSGQQPGADYARLSRSCRLVIDQWCLSGRRAAALAGGSGCPMKAVFTTDCHAHCTCAGGGDSASPAASAGPVGGMITAVLIGLMVPLAFIVTGMLGADDFEPVPLKACCSPVR